MALKSVSSQFIFCFIQYFYLQKHTTIHLFLNDQPCPLLCQRRGNLKDIQGEIGRALLNFVETLHTTVEAVTAVKS